MAISTVNQSLRLRASAEAFDVLRASGSPKVLQAEQLKHSVKSGHEPRSGIVREVHLALLEACAAQPKAEPPSALKKISGIFSRHAAPEGPKLSDVVRRFEQAFISPD